LPFYRRSARTLEIDLEALLNFSSAKDVPHNGTEGVEGKYWTGKEAGLMGILLFLGLIYATGGSKEKGNMGAGLLET